MSTLNATDARSKLYALIDETSKTHKPITITGKRGNAVLLSEEDWIDSCQLHLPVQKHQTAHWKYSSQQVGLSHL